MSKRILHLIDSGGLYGAEQVILALSREMTRDGEFHPVVGCMTEERDPQVELASAAEKFSLEVSYFRLRKLLWPIDLIRLCRQLKRLRIDIIHSHGYKPTVFGYLASRLTGIPITATCHLWFIDQTAPLSMRVLVKIEQWFYRTFSRVVSVSEEISSVLRNADVSAERIRLIPNGILLTDYHKGAVDTAVSDGSDSQSTDGVVRLVNVGRLTPQKAQWSIVDAVGTLRGQGYNVRCAIVGDGELRDELQRQIEEAGLADHIELTGFRNDVGEILKASDIFLLPSLLEGMPIAMLEAVACQIPIVTSLVGDIGKVVVHDESGLVVKAATPSAIVEAVSQLIDVPELAPKLTSAALQRVQERYSSTAMLSGYRDVYADTLNAKMDRRT